jgi:UDP-N-acetylglucosamine:LPS N-acetylglucosamine transferase
VVDGLLAEPARLEAMREAALRMARPGAADTIASEMMRLNG